MNVDDLDEVVVNCRRINSNNSSNSNRSPKYDGSSCSGIGLFDSYNDDSFDHNNTITDTFRNSNNDTDITDHLLFHPYHDSTTNHHIPHHDNTTNENYPYHDHTTMNQNYRYYRNTMTGITNTNTSFRTISRPMKLDAVTNTYYQNSHINNMNRHNNSNTINVSDHITHNHNDDNDDTTTSTTGMMMMIVDDIIGDVMDVTTGQYWGTISRKDKICFLVTIVLVIMVGISSITVLVLVQQQQQQLQNNNNTSTNTNGNNNEIKGDSPSFGSNSNTTNSKSMNGTSIGWIIPHTTTTNTNDTITEQYYSTPMEQYNALRQKIYDRTIITTVQQQQDDDSKNSNNNNENIHTILLQNLPSNYNDFMNRIPSTTTTTTTMNDIYHQAMIWFLYTDPVTIKYESELVPRYVLIVTYIQNNNNSLWTNDKNWMTSYHHCLWYGITCRSSHHTTTTTNNNGGHNPIHSDMIQIDLSNNGLTGSIHYAYILLSSSSSGTGSSDSSNRKSITSILLHSNTLTGTIPGIVFGNLPSLEYLYLQNNQLSGTIPKTLKQIIITTTTTGTTSPPPTNESSSLFVSNTTTSVTTIQESILGTFFVHGNDQLTGIWPIEFCPPTQHTTTTTNTHNNNNNNNTSNNNTSNPDESDIDVVVVHHPIYTYGLNCNNIECSCCDPALHCFN